MRKLYDKTKCRIILSGNTLEIYEFEKPVHYNFDAIPVKHRRELTKTEQDNNRARSRMRAHKMVGWLVKSNFGLWYDEFNKPYMAKFLTLTFAEDIQNVKDGNPHFTLFVKRLNYALFKVKTTLLRYLVVIEFQPASGRVHYHVLLFNLPFIERSRYPAVFEESWGQGFIWINRKKNERKIASYMTKYMTKENDDRLRGQKRYFFSRGLYRPAFLMNELMAKGIKDFMAKEKAISRASYPSEYQGFTKYVCYDIANNPELKELILANQP